MSVNKFRKNELKFYLGMLPQELCDYANKHPENTDYVKLFIDKYRYNYRMRKWIKNES